MCRIAGIVDFHNPATCLRIDAMRDSMTHGGPDDAGSFSDDYWPLAMAVRRLSLLDLSMAGHQPMLSDNRQVVIAFNGEVYNFAALRAELQQLGRHFLSGSDTEVVLQAYQQWGADCFRRFNGMYAVALFDKASECLLLARDHAGMKPLYYCLDAGRRQLYFASECRAFKALRPDWPEDPEWRIRFLAYGHMPEPFTTLQGVQSLPKGHVLQLDLRHFNTRLSAVPAPEAPAIISDPVQAADLLQQALTQAVQRHQVADAPLGVFLSGGIDSSILASLAARSRPQGLSTLSIDFEDSEFSERRYQDLMAEMIQSRHQRFVIGEKDFAAELPDILRAMDQPSTDGINTYFISKYARKAGLKAVLSGIGADELFGGYPTFQRHQWVKRLEWLGPLLGLANQLGSDRLKRISYLRHHSDEARFLFHRGYFTTEQISELTGFSRPRVLEVLGLPERSAPTRETANAYISRLETDFYLKNQLLRDTDYMSMWHSVEVRMPFLDREVINLVQQLPPHIRFDARRPKGFLINTFRHCLPEAVWNRQKMGFIFPFGKWMRSVELRGACHPEYFHLRSQYAKGNIQWSRYWAFCLSAGQPIQVKPPDLRIAFCTLRSFSHMGGIEKFNRSFGLALQQNAVQHNWQVSHLSAYDSAADPRYFAPAAFVGFGRRRLMFILYFLKRQRYYDVHIAGHINLAAMLLLSGWLAPQSRRLLMAHGVEMWGKLPPLARLALKQVHEIWSVSSYTAGRIQAWALPNSLPLIRIFPNTLDPFFAAANQAPLKETMPGAFRYLLTISRLASTEQYKGYDQVIAILPRLVQRFPDLRYVLGGTGDAQEMQRIHGQVAALQLNDEVIMPGFVPEEDLPQYYDSATVFVMPSRKEGFGIVFLEAAWMGMRIIGGNADGSPEALLNGQLGVLIDPADPDALYEALVQQLEEPPLTAAQKEERRQRVHHAFGFEKFRDRQAGFLLENNPARQ